MNYCIVSETPTANNGVIWDRGHSRSLAPFDKSRTTCDQSDIVSTVCLQINKAKYFFSIASSNRN